MTATVYASSTGNGSFRKAVSCADPYRHANDESGTAPEGQSRQIRALRPPETTTPIQSVTVGAATPIGGP
jgi:hypothetical protein